MVVNMNLKDKVALVTGGDRGIGRAISLALADKGCKVVVNYRKNEDEALKTKRMIEEKGAEAMVVKFNVANRDEVRSGVEKIVENFGKIDILVNNAGILGKGLGFEDVDDEDWDEVLDVNLKGAFIVSQEVAKYMKKGKIVNITSIAGRNGGTVGVHYAASKAGLIGLTFAMAHHLAPDIMVTGVAPGPVDTELISQEKKEQLSKLSPLGRIATPEEIAHVVIFLLENDYMTGTIVDINGGRYKL
jgi:3-oxoacyl-[acyl-carrier protein] reductase